MSSLSGCEAKNKMDRNVTIHNQKDLVKKS